MILLCVASGVARGQTPAQDKQRTSADSTTWETESIQAYARRLKLSDLRLASRHTPREVRVWFDLGVGGTELLLLREERPRWRAYSAYPINSDTTAPLTELPDTADWNRLWADAIAAGLLQLPPHPTRHPVNFVITDGYGVTFEWFDGARYGIADAGNPDAYCSADDLRFLKVLGAFQPFFKSGHCVSHVTPGSDTTGDRIRSAGACGSDTVLGRVLLSSLRQLYRDNPPAPTIDPTYDSILCGKARDVMAHESRTLTPIDGPYVFVLGGTGEARYVVIVRNGSTGEWTHTGCWFDEAWRKSGICLAM